jgi:hypothetical protein
MHYSSPHMFVLHARPISHDIIWQLSQCVCAQHRSYKLYHKPKDAPSSLVLLLFSYTSVHSTCPHNECSEMLVTSLRIAVLKICISPIGRKTSHYLALDVSSTEVDVAQLHDAAARQSVISQRCKIGRPAGRSTASCTLRPAAGDSPGCNLTFIHLFGLSLCPDAA